MTNWTHRTMIVPAQFVELARALAAGLEPEAAAGMWTTPLSATGEEPATHYISAANSSPIIPALMADPELLHAACDKHVTLEQCAALLAASDVSEEDAYTAMARVGLMMVRAREASPTEAKAEAVKK